MPIFRCSYVVTYSTVVLLIWQPSPLCTTAALHADCSIASYHTTKFLYLSWQSLYTTSICSDTFVTRTPQGLWLCYADCNSQSSHTSRRHQPDLQKARALGDALTLFSTVPWTLCALVYSFLHCTYPR
jgi:ribosomal protein L37AE/L43A